jgi:hypothetical protein
MSTRDDVLELHVGDRLRLAKQHPCGSHDWRVTRTGADVGLACVGCGRRVLLERRDVERRLSGTVDHTDHVLSPARETAS